MRVLRNLLYVVAGFLILLIAVTSFLLGSEPGSRLLIGALLPETIRIGSIAGRLVGPLVVGQVHVDAPGLVLEIGRAELDWSPRQLFRRRLRIDQLTAEGVDVTLVPGNEPEAEPAPLTLPEQFTLPVAIDVIGLSVDGIQFRTAAEADVFVIDKVRLAAGFDDAELVVTTLDVAARSFDADATANFKLTGAYPLSAAINVQFRPDGYAEVRSTTKVWGDLQLVRVQESLAPPYNISANVSLAAPLEQLAFDLDVVAKDLRLADVQATLPDVVVDLQATAHGALADLSMQAEFAVLQQQERLIGSLVGGLKSTELVIESLDLELADHQSRISAQGNVKLDEGFDTDASVTWQNLYWPLVAEPAYRSTSGRVAVAGTLDSYNLSTNAELTLPGGVPLQAEVSAQGNRASANLELGLDLLAGHVAGVAAVAWQPTFNATVTLDGSGIDPAALQPDLPGHLDFNMRGAVDIEGEKVTAQLQAMTVNGELRGQAVSLESTGAFESGAIVVDALEARFGSTRLSAHGRYAETAEFRWRLEGDDLSEISSELQGHVSGNGMITGAPPRLSFDAQLDTSNLGYQDLRIETFDLSADIDLSDESASSFVVNLSGLTNPTIGVERVALDLVGKLDSHRLQLSAATSQGDADVLIEGKLIDPWTAHPAWQFALTEAVLSYPDLDPWRLSGRADGRLSAEAASIDNHCWFSDAARICMSGERTADRTQLGFNLENLGFDYFAALLPAAWQLDGSVSGEGALEQVGDAAPHASISLRTSAGSIDFKTEMDRGEIDDAVPAAPLLDLEPSEVSVTFDDAGARARVALSFAQAGFDLEATLAKASAPYGTWPLDGHLGVDVPDVGFALPFLPEVDALHGKIGGSLAVEGSLERPSLSGKIELTDGALALPVAGLEIRDIMLAIVGRGPSGIGIEGSAKSGDGTLALKGVLAENNDPMVGSIDISGENFHLLGTKEAQLFVSPSLNVTAQASDIRVAGTVRIPRADITPTTIPESAVAASDDVIELGPETASGEAAPVVRPILADVKIILGDEVRFDGFGLKARFEGETTVMERPNQPTSARGEIRIPEGEYRAYGQGLVIENGRIVFAGGPIAQLALDIRAVRRPQQGILVGTHVRGTLERPDFTLFSEPPMSQQEQLSFLVLGRSLEEAPAGERSALAQASLALGVRGGNFLAQHIGKRLGVDEFSIKSGSGEAGAASDPADAALVVGKYLSPKLYLSYGIGLFNAISTLRMQYEFNRMLKLVTESSSKSTGTDLFYTIERGD